jgi:hypothetical protein
VQRPRYRCLIERWFAELTDKSIRRQIEPAHTAQDIADELDALRSRSVLEVRRMRRRWSFALPSEEPAAVLAVAEALLGTTAPRFLAYELVLCHRGALSLVDQTVAERLAGDEQADDRPREQTAGLPLLR